MLTHIVCWKYKTETTEAERENHRAKLKNLAGIIPDILSFSIGADVLHLTRSFDTGLTATFADRAALDAYTVHAEHQSVVDLGKLIAEKVVSVDFIS